MEKINLPRFECIGDYPNNPYKLQDVIYKKDSVIIGIDKYPAVFRKMEWYERRKPSEMPKYIKIINDDYTKSEKSFGKREGSQLRRRTVWKVKEWKLRENSKEISCALVIGCNMYVWRHDCAPATEEEYLSATKKEHRYKEIDDFPFGPLVNKKCIIRIMK